MDKSIEMKDEKLNYIIKNDLGNIAQYISVGLDNRVRFVHINNYQYNPEIELKSLIIRLLESAPSGLINIRSYSPEVMKGNKLIYGKKVEDIDEILSIIENNSKSGKYSIINENIDINDGGVSGVILGNIIEFSPKDTPKCVDKEGVCQLPREIGYDILKKIYGFKPDIKFDHNYRVEFSIHPQRQGVKRQHTIIWEYEYYGEQSQNSTMSWPNNFSRFIGDKTYGLLLADRLGFDVPMTTVISRELPPFTFGKRTDLHEKWIRTCPIEKEPGKYFTGDRWQDPFSLMNEEERKGNEEINIASILSQDAVEAVFSGASIIKEKEDKDIIEGTLGKGDGFMVGETNIINIPKNIMEKVKETNNNIRELRDYLGEASIEWVYDGEDLWIVQLNQLKVSGSKNIIVEGKVKEYIEFDVSRGLEALRVLINNIKNKNIGIELVGNIGITSHFGDLLRINKIVSKLRRK